MEQSELEKEFNRIKGLKQNSKKSDAEMHDEALQNLRVREFATSHYFADEEEKKLAKAKYASYLDNYKLDTISDLDTLADLVINEIHKSRIEKMISEYFERNAEQAKLDAESKDEKSKKINCYIPEKQLEAKQTLENHILELKVKLGIDKEQKEDELTSLQLLEKRFQAHIAEHREEFTTACKACGEMLLMRRPVKDFEVLKHPWYAGRWLFNYEILKDVKDGLLTKEQAWRYLVCASTNADHNPNFMKDYTIDYINHCLNHWTEITELLENQK